MGDFRIEIEAVGGHGCERHLADGDQVHGCDMMYCPDCRTREFVTALQTMGIRVTKATLTHYPVCIKNEDGSERYKKENEVVDDLLTRIRMGKFPEYEEAKKLTLPVKRGP